MALVYSKNTHYFFSLSKARPSGLRAMNVSMSVCVKINGVGGVVFFDVFSKFGPVLARSWWEDLMQSHVFQNLVSCIYCKYVLRPSLRYIDVCGRL